MSVQIQGPGHMHLVVRKSDGTTKEFRFTSGPVYIGRHKHSQIFLPDITVSRQHAVIYKTQDGKWILEDLDSANKTFLNNQLIQKTEIATGDSIRITNFTIEVNLEVDTGFDSKVPLEDTLVTAAREPQVIVRTLDFEQAADITLPAKRIKDFADATETICEANGFDQLLEALLDVTEKQFDAFHIWCALRDEPSGPMTVHAGKSSDGKSIQLSGIKLSEKINEAVEKKQFLLMPKVPPHLGTEKVQSAMIAPIISPRGCFGVLYLDNAIDYERYTLSDLDYLMLLAIQTASILRNF